MGTWVIAMDGDGRKDSETVEAAQYIRLGTPGRYARDVLRESTNFLMSIHGS